eukprot:scaffold9568_cov20-Tisochrysis_lutea.AAC.1
MADELSTDNPCQTLQLHRVQSIVFWKSCAACMLTRLDVALGSRAGSVPILCDTLGPLPTCYEVCTMWQPKSWGGKRIALLAGSTIFVQ